MALAELAAQLSCTYGPDAVAAREDRDALGAEGVAVCLEAPAFEPAIARATAAGRWIATDLPPALVQRWPALEPVPAGWHVVSDEEARRLQGKPSITIIGGLAALPDASRLAALSTVDSPADAIADRRPGRTPREARFARLSRLPRPPRAARLERAPRAPRRSRPPRPPRPPRARRPPRPRRAPFKKTKYSVGVCKRPACTCWTPAGCAGPDAWEMIKALGGAEIFAPCFPGPCFDYVACVTHRCSSDAACALFQILQFWIKQYQRVAAYVDPVLQPVVQAPAALQRALLGALPGLQTLGLVSAPAPSIGVTEGCPPGTRWAVGLTGFSCQSPATHPVAATREQLVAAGILPP